MLSGFLRERARLALVVVAATLLCWWLLRPSPPLAGAGGAAPPHDAGEEQLAAALTGRGLVLEPHSLLLPELPPAGGWGPLAWRVAIFAAAPDDDAAAPGVAEGGDIYRAELRFSAGSRLLDLRRLKNVTRTSSALERLLHGAGSRSLWSVQVGGMVRELLLVDAARDDREFEEKAGWAQHRLAALTNRLQTGQWAGVGLYSYNLLTPATRVEVAPASSDGRVSVLLFHGGEQAHSQATFDLGRQEVVAGKEEATFRPRFWAGTPVIHWMVDTVRSLPWVGPRPIALLEKWVFTAQNVLTDIGYRLGLVHVADVADELGLPTAPEIHISATGTGRPAPGLDASWPPPALPPLLPSGQAGEGQWFPYSAPWLKTIPDAPPAFFKTALRLPGSPPYLVVLVAMDLRQLELGMVGGLGTPWSSTGRRGTGRIPREPERLARTVAAFNGGFQTAHGAFGMMVDGELILEPWQKMATLALLEDGTLRMGTWNNSIEVPADIRSFRQNMPPLLEDGVWNPANQRFWGGTISDLDQVNTARSAMGYRGDHVLLYAWSEQVSAKGIAEALLHAGAEYGIHLDMNPAHAGFGLLDIDPAALDPKSKSLPRNGYSALAPSKTQSFDLDRFANRNGKDFFYLMLRRSLPQQLPLPPQGFGPWVGRSQARAGLPESFLPALAIARNEASAELLAVFELSSLRATFQLGGNDTRLLERVAGRLQDELARAATLRHPLALIDLDSIDGERPVGLAMEGQVLSSFVGAWASLAVDRRGGLRLLPPGATAPVEPGAAAEPGAEPIEPGVEPAVTTGRRQGCPLLVDGQLSARALPQTLGATGQRHHALGLSPAGLLVYLTSTSDAQAMAGLLAPLGVQDALLLPDGNRSRLLLLHPAAQGQSLLAEDPLHAEQRPLVAVGSSSSRILLDRVPERPRISRLQLPDVQLSPEELAGQKRVQARIMEKRQELRVHANEAYQDYIEKVRTALEAKEQGKLGTARQ